MFPFMPFSCGLGHRRISILPGLHKAVASRQGQGFILQATRYAFPLTNPRHTLLSYTILLACLTSKHFFFMEFFTVSIHLFHVYPLNDYQHTPLHRPSYHSPFSPHGRTTNLSVAFVTWHAFRTLSILYSEIPHLYSPNLRSLFLPPISLSQYHM